MLLLFPDHAIKDEKTVLSSLIQKLRQSLFPPTCVLCAMPSDNVRDLCQDCASHLPWQDQAVCRHCGIALPMTHESVCGACLMQTPTFDQLYALFDYLPPIDKLIMDAKFHDKLINTRLLGQLLSEQIQQRWYCSDTLPQAIMPVPLHPSRLRQRGYNQASEIAKPIAKALKLPIYYDHCRRHKATAAQSGLKAKARAANIKNAFVVNQPINVTHIAILDDVVTTGQTVIELSRVLKQAGVQRIDIWCCARTPK